MDEKILATVSASDFIGRTRETETLMRHANGETRSRGLLLLSAPGTGASELLKQIGERLFSEQGATIPFYFAVKSSDRTATDCAARFLQTFIAQTVAFRRQDKRIIDISPDIDELAELVTPQDGDWIDRLVAVYQSRNQSNNERAFLRNCLSAPLRAAARGANSFVIIDNLHEADAFSGDVDFIEELKEIFSRSTVSFVLAGRRRFLLNAARTGNTRLEDAEILRVETLDSSAAELLAENLADKYAVKINDQTRDLIARQFDGNPSFIKFLLQASNERQMDLDSFQSVEQVYTDELFGGRMGKFYDAVFQKIAPNVETQKNIVGFLHDALTIESDSESRHLNDIFKNLRDDEMVSTREDLHRLMSLFNAHELVRLSSNLIEPSSENDVLSDYLRARFRLETAGENRALVVGEMLSGFLKRAPQTMAKFRRRKSSIGLREILSAFNCQEAPARLFDYSIFKANDEAANAIAESEAIRLPQVVFSAHTVAFYPAIGRVLEKTHSAVALGFKERVYTDENETVWIAAEIDSRLEASSEAAEFWCDRLEMVALTCDFTKYKIWLVAPEGFTPEAMKVLRRRDAYGSSRRQVELLAKFLQTETAGGVEKTAEEYEIVVPTGDEAEFFTVGTLEEIARRHFFEPRVVNQIKTALVEACFNVSEHGLNFDRKIHQKFTVEADRIVITISSRGFSPADKIAEEIEPAEGRRGWSLKLLRSLMDEVKFEFVDDETKISMTKYLKK